MVPRTPAVNPWVAVPDGAPSAPPRRVVTESWQRALRRNLDPERLLPAFDLPDDDLDEYRRGHPLFPLLSVVRRLLVEGVDDTGLVVAIGDDQGRILWIEGDRAAKRSAEDIRFVEGAGWAENRVGTSAPGTALVLDHGIQIRGREHFNHLVQQWSCTAVPVHDPVTRGILGFLDITGDERAVGPNTLPLLEATATAMEAELMVSRLRAASRTPPGRPRTPPVRPRSSRGASTAQADLHVLGRDVARLSDGRRNVTLSARHSELMTLLDWHSTGLPAEDLAGLLYGDGSAQLTLRAEMVRLRHALEGLDPQLAPLSRPYRLVAPLASDARQVLALLDRGAHRQAVEAYTGPVLPGSVAPGVQEIREAIRSRVRDALLTDASLDVLIDYAGGPEGENDRDVLMAALQRLAPKSPRRAGLVARLEYLDRL